MNFEINIEALIKVVKTQELIVIYCWFLPLLELDFNTKLVQNIKLAELVLAIIEKG